MVVIQVLIVVGVAMVGIVALDPVMVMDLVLMLFVGMKQQQMMLMRALTIARTTRSRSY